MLLMKSVFINVKKGMSELWRWLAAEPTSCFTWDWQGGVFKVMKNDHFLVFLAVWLLFPKLIGRLSDGLC